MRASNFFFSVLFFCSLGIANLSYGQETLNFSLLIINGNQRSAYLEIVQEFENKYPQIKVNIQAIDSEPYKESMDAWLKKENHSDVMYWFSGQRLNWFTSKDLVEPIDDLWQTEAWEDRFTKSSQSAVKFHEKFYAIPIHYYNWGIYFNTELFNRLKLSAPHNWDEFLGVCERLKQAGIAPIVIGTEEDWPVAGWFDYINLRTNGLSFHQDLLQGKISYQDDRVRKVFEKLAYLVKKGYFIRDHETMTWKESLPYLYRGLAGMMLMGNFWTSQMPESMNQTISVFRFPVMNPELPFFEEAPTNVLFIPKNVKNKKNAELFLKFMAQADVQQRLNQKLGMLAPQNNAVSVKNHFLEEGQSILAKAEGLSQYYDRDSPQPIALKGMKEFKRFLLDPSALEDVLLALEKLRKESFALSND